MKAIKTIILALLIGSCAGLLNGQVKVNSNGVVDFGTKVKIDGSYSNSWPGAIYFNGAITNIISPGNYASGVYSKVLQNSSSAGGNCIGLYGMAQNDVSGKYPVQYIGVRGDAYATGSTGRAVIGVAGIAGNCNNSVGIFGSVDPFSYNTSFGFSSGVRYAGYFQGNVYIKGGISVTTLTYNSDERLKKNIEAINKENTVEKLFSLRPIKYNLKQIETDADSLNAKGEKVSFKLKRYNEDEQYFKKSHYGLVAQELQKVYPELVYEGGDGYLEVDYIGLIPLLLQAAQQQQKEIEELRMQNSYNVPTYLSAGETEAIEADPALTQYKLFQNAPNPFNISTTIKYQLSDNATNAKICVYNLTGKQLQCYNLPATKGENSIEVRASSLQAGMYLYSLIVGDKLIDTKRMVLTE